MFPHANVGDLLRRDSRDSTTSLSREANTPPNKQTSALLYKIAAAPAWAMRGSQGTPIKVVYPDPVRVEEEYGEEELSDLMRNNTILAAPATLKGEDLQGMSIGMSMSNVGDSSSDDEKRLGLKGRSERLLRDTMNFFAFSSLHRGE